MRFRRWALIGGALILAAWAALLIVVKQLDAGSLAQSLAQSVEASTGRQLSIGEARLKILPRPAVVLSNVRFANAEWGSQPSLAEAGRVYAAIDLMQLLGGRLRIKHVELSQANVLFETGPDGTGNWRMGRNDATAPPSLAALDIDEVTLEAVQVTYRNGKTAETTQVAIETASFSTSAQGMLRIAVRAQHAIRKVDFEGTVGALTGLLADTPAWPVDLKGKIGGATVSVHGNIDVPRELRGINLNLNAQIPEFADYIGQIGAKVPPLGAFRGSTRLTGSVDAPVFSEIDMELGTQERMRLAIRGELAGALMPAGAYDWRSNGLDFDLQGTQFGELGQWYGRTLPAWGAYHIVARATGPGAAPAFQAIDAQFGGGERPEIRVRGAIGNWRTMSGLDVRVTASAKEWWRSVLVPEAPPLPPFRASARVRDARNGYRVDDLELKIAENAVSASLTVLANGPRLRIAGKAASPLIDLSRLTRAPAGAARPRGAATAATVDRWKVADIDLDLKLARVVLPDGSQLQSLNGRLALEDGRIEAHALQAGFANATVKADGSIGEPAKMAGLDLKLALQGAELADFLKFFNSKFPPVGPFQGRAQLRGSLDSPSLSDIDATVGKSGQNLRFAGTMEDARKLQNVRLAITANISDSTAAGALFGMEIPRLPPVRASALATGAPGGYELNDLKMTLGRSSLQGRLAYAAGDARPRVAANVSGPLLDLAELPSIQTKPDAPNPLLAADVDAELKFNRVVLPDRHTLGPVSGSVRLTAGAVELKQFVAAVDGASATFDGRIADPLKLAQLELMLNAQVTHGGGLAALTGLQLKDVPAFTATAKLTDHANGYTLTGLKLSGTMTTLAGDLTVTKGAQRMKLIAKATSPLLDLSAFVAPPPEAAPRPAGAKLIPDVPLPLDVLRALDGDFDLRFDTVKLGDAPALGPLTARATLIDGVLKAEPVALAAKPGQTLSVAGTVDAGQSRWALRIKGNGIDFGDMLARLGRRGMVSGGSTDLALDFDGRGKTLAALAGSLNGDAWVKVGPFQIHNFAVPLDRGTIVHMFGLANPFLKADPDTDVKCFAARMSIKNGVINSERKVATETAKYNAVMSGTVNLRTEQLDLSVTPVVRGEVKTVVHLRGTLAAPTVEVNAVGAIARSAVSAGATVATLGGWWMADTLLGRAAADPSPCATALVP